MHVCDSLGSTYALAYLYSSSLRYESVGLYCMCVNHLFVFGEIKCSLFCVAMVQSLSPERDQP